MKEQCRRIAPDSSVVNWKAYQGREPSVQEKPANRREYQAIEKLFELQAQGQIVLVALDQVDKEISRTSNEANRGKLIETLRLCKEKHYLTRFESQTKSKWASRAKGKVGINLGNGAYYITDDNIRKIEEYTTFGDSLEEKVDLEILATAAIAGVKVVVFVDNKFLSNKRVKAFAKQKDNIDIYTPSQAIRLLAQEEIMKLRSEFGDVVT